MKHTFRILFYIKKNAPLRNGNVPIMGRITIAGKSVQLSTQLSVNPALWELNPGRAVGRSPSSGAINDQLHRIRRRLERCYEQLLDRHLVITPQMVKECYFGRDYPSENLLVFFRRHNTEFYRMVGINRSLSTYYKYRCVYRHLQDFISSHYGCEDMALENIDRGFLIGFHHFIAQACGHKKNTVWVYLIAFKHILKLAINQGYLTHDPFADYKLHSEDVPRSYLTFEEINRLIRLEIIHPKIRLIRDAFLFSCFTGLSFVDIRALSPGHIQRENDRVWIRLSRRKTGTETTIRLLSVPGRILSEYGAEGHEGPFFRLPGNRTCNLSLQQVMSMAGIQRHITFHCARHTFATTVTLSQGMAIETISKLLGHKNIRTTQIYAKVTNSKLDRDMERLSERLDALCTLLPPAKEA